eukprot:scaffold2191_cov92-Skeletonema_marinoi.AAC.2
MKRNRRRSLSSTDGDAYDMRCEVGMYDKALLQYCSQSSSCLPMERRWAELMEREGLQHASMIDDVAQKK